METNLLNQNDQPYNSQDLNQQNVTPPDPQPYTQPAAQIPTQPYYAQPAAQIPAQPYYAQPVIQTVPQQYIGQAPQPYAALVPPQQYVTQPYYLTQPGIMADSNFKKKLRCPRVFAWIVFAINVITTLLSFVFVFFGGFINIYPIVSCIIFFIIDFFINQSIEQKNVISYSIDLTLFFVVLVFYLFSIVLVFYLIKIHLFYSIYI